MASYNAAVLLSLCSLSLATPFGLYSNGTGYNETLARHFASLASVAYCTNLSMVRVNDAVCPPPQAYVEFT